MEKIPGFYPGHKIRISNLRQDPGRKTGFQRYQIGTDKTQERGKNNGSLSPVYQYEALSIEPGALRLIKMLQKIDLNTIMGLWRRLNGRKKYQLQPIRRFY